MKYSYIRPRKKSIFTPELKLLSTFFSISLFMLLLTYAFLLFKDYSFTNDLKNTQKVNVQLHAYLQEMKEQIIYVEKEKVLAQGIKTENAVLRDSIRNLFDLVPQRITLSDALLDKNSLVLKGITPNKDVYNFMLQAPLRSIFHQTYSSFYPAGNGWMYFVSTNYTDEENHED